MELTILMPCLNEENTIAACIAEATQFLEDNQIEGEVLVVDNGSTDASAERAEAAGARVLSLNRKGYGSALCFGIERAKGTCVIMADCDCSYSFLDSMAFLEKLRMGADMVIGDRFAIPMEPGAMSFSHRYIGVPFLSFLGRCCFHTEIHDFHCGLRAVRRESFLSLGCRSSGMEFATEMIARAALHGQKLTEVPVSFRRDKRGHRSHLRSVRDGLRHLRLTGELTLSRRKAK